MTATREGGRRAAVVDTSRSPYARLRPLPLEAVRFDDVFWTTRLRTVRATTLPSQYEQCERTGRIDNFRRAAGKKQVPFQGRYYNDSDVYKWLEAASFALAHDSGSAGAEAQAWLRRTVEAVIDEIAAAQSPDGYLNTYFTFERAAERFTNLAQMHELYCAGHLIQAAVAHHRATGERRLLQVATRLADHICATFGPQARLGTDGHEEIELALVELYRETGNRTYLDRAGFFLDMRGRQPPVLNGSVYLQDHLPVRVQREIVGHAVRATYLACGMADVYAETGEAALLEALEALWQSAFERKVYATGGLGARWSGESFGDDYELPNERAYAETCAAIGGVMWNWRMLLCCGEARFADWLETALYNGVLAGLSLDGARYFYQNPLADRGRHRRRDWFETACCPPNVARLLMSLPGYCYSISDDELWVHLYVAGHVRAALPAAGTVSLRIETAYPWEGLIHCVIEEAPEVAASLVLRVPGWSAGAMSVRLNGKHTEAPVTAGGYVALRSHWRTGDEVELELPMPVQQLVAHPHVLADTGRVALARGPLVYCVEGADHPHVDVWDLELPDDAPVAAERRPDLLGGVVALVGEAVAAPAGAWDSQLYLPTGQQPPILRQPTPLRAIPYYAWANREPGPMAVWLRRI